jgi:succinoglycan biosynthesis transport protein ExoP
MNSHARLGPAAVQPLHADDMPPPQRFEPATAFSDDLKVVMDTLRRRSGWFFLGFVPVQILAASWILFSTPLFTAAATVVLDPRTPSVASSPEVLSDVPPDSPLIDTQVQLIRSRVVLGKVVDDLRLQNELDFGVEPSSAAAAEEPRSRRNELINVLAENLDVARVGLTYALQIRYTDDDAVQAARVANAVAAAYLEHQRNVKQQATKDANEWLQAQVSELETQVERAEADVEAYRSRSGLLVAQGSTSTESQLTNLDLGFNEARQTLSNAQAKLAGYRSALARLGAAGAAEIVVTPMMEQLRTQYAELTNQRAQLSSGLGPLHPQMVELNQQLNGLQEQMNAEAQRTIDELTSEVTIAENRVAGLLAIRDQSRARLAEDNVANVELAQLQTNAESLRTLYEAMLTRLGQTTAQETLGQVNATVVSEAVPPFEPSSPKTNIILASAIGIGLALGALAVLLVQLFDKTVVRPEEFERRTRVPILALVPQLKAEDLSVGGKPVPAADVVIGRPMSLFAESFRNLRVAVATQGPLVLQMTSGTFAEGKTLSSIAFSRTAAMDGKRVLLIDADVRRRSLTQCLGITTQLGLIELLKGKAELHDVIVPGEASRTPHVLPLSSIDAGPHDLFSTETFDDFLQKIKLAFDVVVFDSAPVLAVAEPLSLAKRVDVVVLVAKWGQTPIEIVLKALEEIQRAGGNVVGTLLTHVDVEKVTKQSYGRQYYPALMKYYQQ